MDKILSLPTKQISYKIREATIDDMKFVTGIYAHHVVSSTASFELVPPSIRQIKRTFQEINQSDLPYLVAEAGNKILGFCYAASYRSRPAYKFTVENSVYIAPNNEGLGVGTSLLTVLLNKLGNGDFKTVVAVIGDSGNLASIRLHKKCGFAEVGVLKSVGFKFGHWVDTVIMQRVLGA
uniref:Phosphinothricin acetyltransferase n=1 Tax=uncultured microorganism TaxID=358574 RepID=A0A650F3R8_9ZZZZ|nr:phosphinothricin acetyltransferase [uncultured microorganism]